MLPSWLLRKFLVHLLREKRPIDLGDRRVLREARYRRESPKARKKRLRKFREQRKHARMSADDRRMLDGLERTANYSNGYACYVQPKTPGKKSANMPEKKRLWVAKQVYEYLHPDRKDSIHFLENENEKAERKGSIHFLENENRRYSKGGPRSLEKGLWRFEREYIAPGKLDRFQLVESEFSSFKQSEVARLHRNLYQGFPRLGIPRSNIEALTNMMQITECEDKLLRSICKQSAERLKMSEGLKRKRKNLSAVTLGCRGGLARKRNLTPRAAKGNAARAAARERT